MCAEAVLLEVEPYCPVAWGNVLDELLGLPVSAPL